MVLMPLLSRLLTLLVILTMPLFLARLTLIPIKYLSIFFFFNYTSTTEIYTLSLHDALPIFGDPVRHRHRFLLIVRDVDERNAEDRKSTRLNSSHVKISYAVFCLKKKKH